MTNFHLTRNQLLLDLHQAYLDARRHKRKKPYQQFFESRLEANLTELCNELWNRDYRARPSTCFLITDPKLREVFAADFRDRIVHHLYFNYVHRMLERTFIQDSYSCIKGRGTHYGIHRLEQHIRQESQNYQEPCWVLKFDIRGYFMHINRERLLEITLSSLEHMMSHCIEKNNPLTWQEVVDMDFVRYLTREIVLLDPTQGCILHGNPKDWERLPKDKSLFYSTSNCGLPIGNLTSQLFSNVYMNVLDQWMKRESGCRHYGRYVDDFYVVSADRDWLKSLVPRVRDFLLDRLGLELQEGKLAICNVRYGVEFLGAYLKPWRNYASNRTLRRMSRKIHMMASQSAPLHAESSMASFRGVLCHYKGRRRHEMVLRPMVNLLSTIEVLKG